MARKNKPKPSAGSVPTYIRFTSDQLIAMDEAIKKGSFLVRNGGVWQGQKSKVRCHIGN